MTTLITQLANALGIRIAGQSRPESHLFKQIATKECLILIDNGEHLDADGREFLVRLLSKTTSLKLLVTSRHRLKVKGETLFPIGGLPFPETNDTTAHPYASIACFEARASQIDTTFKPNQQDQEAIIKITQLTEGLPLALKLAASWVRLLSCPEIAAKIEQSVKNLSTTLEDEALRHRSMWGVFNQAWELIGPELRQILANLAVFEGGFSEHAAEEIVETSLVSLATLLDFSLVERRPFGSETELRLHPLLRQYLQEKRPVEPHIIEKHTHYYGDQLELLLPKVDSPELAEAFMGLDRMWGNIQAGWSSAVAQQDLPLINRYACALHDLLTVRGWPTVGANMLQQAITFLLGKSDSNTENATMLQQVATRLLNKSSLENQAQKQAYENKILVWTRVFARLGNFLADAGQLIKAERHLKISLLLVGQIEDETELRYVYGRSVLLAIKRGEWNHADQLIQKSRQMNEGVIPLTLGTQYLNEGAVKYHLGQFEQARTALLASISHFNVAKARWGEGHARRWLGATEYNLGNYDTSEAQLQKSAALHSEQNDLFGYALAQCQWGQIACWQGNFDLALDRLNIALQQAEKIGHETLFAMIEIELADTYFYLQRYQELENYLNSALKRVLVLEQTPLLLKALAALIKFSITKGFVSEDVTRLGGAIVNHENGSYIVKSTLRQWLTDNGVNLNKDHIDRLLLDDIKSVSQQVLVISKEQHE